MNVNRVGTDDRVPFSLEIILMKPLLDSKPPGFTDVEVTGLTYRADTWSRSVLPSVTAAATDFILNNAVETLLDQFLAAYSAGERGRLRLAPRHRLSRRPARPSRVSLATKTPEDLIEVRGTTLLLIRKCPDIASLHTPGRPPGTDGLRRTGSGFELGDRFRLRAVRTGHVETLRAAAIFRSIAFVSVKHRDRLTSLPLRAHV